MMRSWSLVRASFLAGAFVLMFGLTARTQQTPPGQDDEHKALPAGEGRELMIRVCGQCHSPDSAADQQLDAKGWKDLVNDMASKGADVTDAEVDQIVNYLAKAFPVSK